MSDIIAGMLLLVALVSAATLCFRLVTTLVRSGRISSDWEVRILATAVFFGSILVLLVEVISLLRLLSAFGLAASWLFVSVLLQMVRQHLEQKLLPESASVPPLITREARNWTREEILLTFGIGGTLALLFAIKVLHPPAAEYPVARELVRVLQWIQAGSVAHFATYDIRLVQSGPFEAFTLLHAYLIGDGDQLARLVPWAFLLLSLVAVSALAALFLPRFFVAFKSPARLRTAKFWCSAFLLALLLALNMTFPDRVAFVAAFCLLSISVCGLLLTSQPANHYYAALLGASLGLIILAEQRLFLAGAIVGGVLLLVAMSRGGGTAIRLRLAGSFLIAFIGLAAPHSLRNFEVFGTPGDFSPDLETELTALLLLVPFVVLPLARRTLASIKIGIAVVFLVIVCSSIVFSQARSDSRLRDGLHETRQQERFSGVSSLYGPAAEAADDILLSASTNVALHIQNPAEPLAKIEYAIIALMNDAGFEGNISYFGITNVTARLSVPPTPQVLLTSESASESLKFRTSYGPIEVSWSELASRWVQLKEHRPDKTERILSSTNQEVIRFHGGAATLSRRAARQGVLTLEGGFGDDQGLLSTNTALSIRSRTGFMTTLRSTGALHVAEIPLPPGQIEFQIGPGFPPPSNTVFALRKWRWYPTEQPLPFIYLSKVSSKASLLDTNSIVLAAGSDLSVELISGATGIIDVQFYSHGLDRTDLEIRSDSFRTNVTFRAGNTAARVPIDRGTNYFTLSTTSTDTVFLDQFIPRFRDFEE